MPKITKDAADPVEMLSATEAQMNATKKKSKKKNQSKLTSKSDECETNSNSDSHAVTNQLGADNDENSVDGDRDGGGGSVNKREIQFVSEELLKRLQINGATSTPKSIAVNEMNSAKKSVAATRPQHTIIYHNNNNNNNNSCKQTSNQVKTKCETPDALCNGAKHKRMNDDEATLVRPNSGNRQQSIGIISSNAQQSLPIDNAELRKKLTQSKDVSGGSGGALVHSAEAIKSSSAATSIAKPNISSKVMGQVPSGASNTIRIAYKEYESELQMPDIMRVIQRELSEPYSIYTYRYFIHNWPKLCFLAMHDNHCVGAIVCKLDIHRQVIKRGYIAMLAVEQDYRKLKVGTTLVQKAIEVNQIISI